MQIESTRPQTVDTEKKAATISGRDYMTALAVGSTAGGITWLATALIGLQLTSDVTDALIRAGKPDLATFVPLCGIAATSVTSIATMT